MAFGINGLFGLFGANDWLKAEIARRHADLDGFAQTRQSGTREGLSLKEWRSLPDSPTADPSKLKQVLPQ